MRKLIVIIECFLTGICKQNNQSIGVGNSANRGSIFPYSGLRLFEHPGVLARKPLRNFPQKCKFFLLRISLCPAEQIYNSEKNYKRE